MIIKVFCFVLLMLTGIVPVSSAGDDIIAVTQFDASALAKGVPQGVPHGWELDLKKGKSYVNLIKTGDAFCLHLYSSKSSFGLKKGVKVDIREYPYLNWEWAVTKLPPKGDARKSTYDDQALQLYIAFPKLGWPEKLNTPILGYISSMGSVAWPHPKV